MLVKEVAIVLTLGSVALRYDSVQSLSFLVVAASMGITRSSFVQWLFFCAASCFVLLSQTSGVLVQHMLACIAISLPE